MSMKVKFILTYVAGIVNRYCFDFYCRPFYGEISSNIYIKQRCSDV